jgi:putative FmdB family regulatory protein
MPIYEYRCAACGHQQEFLQKVSDAPPKDCPKCGKPELAKLLSAAGFQLKGSGWYATDFRNKATAPAKSGGDAAKSDAKPASDSAGGTSSSGGGTCGAGGCSSC